MWKIQRRDEGSIRPLNAHPQGGTRIANIVAAVSQSDAIRVAKTPIRCGLGLAAIPNTRARATPSRSTGFCSRTEFLVLSAVAVFLSIAHIGIRDTLAVIAEVFARITVFLIGAIGTVGHAIAHLSRLDAFSRETIGDAGLISLTTFTILLVLSIRTILEGVADIQGWDAAAIGAGVPVTSGAFGSLTAVLVLSLIAVRISVADPILGDAIAIAALKFAGLPSTGLRSPFGASSGVSAAGVAPARAPTIASTFIIPIRTVPDPVAEFRIVDAETGGTLESGTGLDGTTVAPRGRLLPPVACTARQRTILSRLSRAGNPGIRGTSESLRVRPRNRVLAHA